MGYGVWCMGVLALGYRYGLWGYGLWAMGYGIWDMGYGVWDMGYGMGYGVWGMGYGWDSNLGPAVLKSGALTTAPQGRLLLLLLRYLRFWSDNAKVCAGFGLVQGSGCWCRGRAACAESGRSVRVGFARPPGPPE